MKYGKIEIQLKRTFSRDEIFKLLKKTSEEKKLFHPENAYYTVVFIAEGITSFAYLACIIKYNYVADGIPLYKSPNSKKLSFQDVLVSRDVDASNGKSEALDAIVIVVHFYRI